MSELTLAAIGIAVALLVLAGPYFARVAFARFQEANREWSKTPVSYSPLWFVAALAALLLFL